MAARHALRRPVRRRALISLVGTVALVASGASTAQAASITSAVLTGGAGTAVVGGTLFAKPGSTLTLTVTADSQTKCVDAGVFGRLTTGGSPFVFPGFTVPSGTGSQTITVVAGNGNNAGGCNGNTATTQATYSIDSTAPVVTGTAAPAANGAGWNKSDVTITWSATDTGGSGVASGPTPATDTVTTDTSSVTKQATAVDRVGNTGTGNVTVKLDKTAPTINGSRTPAANSNGWNNTDVTVSFTCNDATAGVKSCLGGTPLAGSGANQSVTGTATDNADNTASTTVSNINIDKTPPTLSGAPTTSPNGAGWYKNNVVIHWTPADPLSGIDPTTTPADSTISSEGTGLTASASVSDKAGNTTSATSTPPVKIDKTAPTTVITGDSNNWVNHNVTVTLSPSDNLSGVKSTTYTLDGGGAQSGTSFVLSTEGDHVVTYFSTDNADNVESTHTAHIKIDKTAPTIGHVFLPSDYTDGAWTNAPKVTVHFQCADQVGLSGVASCGPDTDVTAEGPTVVTGTSTDNAGNGPVSNSATVKIDRTQPTVTATADRGPNGNGWYNADVIVSFACADQLLFSGVHDCPGNQTLSEGADQTATGTAHDVAGNAGTGSLAHLNIDKTPPVITGTTSPAPNGDGWNHGAVTVTWHCSDPLSGLATACPPPTVVSGEGDNLSASVSVDDKAGNTGTGTVTGIHIDMTPPVTTASLSAPLASGWYAASAHVTLSALDALSHVNTTYYAVDGGTATTYSGPFDFSTTGIHTITFWSVDHAGNIEDNTPADHSVVVKIDNIKPTISGSASPAPNAAGWNNSDVSVAFNCSDAESGIQSCLGDTTLTTDGASQSVVGTATDNGGNVNTATVGPINLDETPPSLSGTPTTLPNGNGWYNAPVIVQWSATDATSGVDTSTLPADTTVSTEGADVSTGPVSVRDIAGNSTTASVDHLKIDQTAPGIAGTPDRQPNLNGWYNANVAVSWHCVDLLSGIPDHGCPADSTITGEGSALSATASVSDRADNTSSATFGGVHIDRTAPSTDFSAPSEWTNTGVTIDFTATDNLSGVAATHYTVNGGPTQTGDSLTLNDEGVYELEIWSVDNADNVETHKSATVLIDKTAPTISHTQNPPANADGWNNVDVTITFHCDDTLSGIATCTSPITETHEGQDQPEPGTATDRAGNSATDNATVSIDKSAPTIVGAPDRAANGAGWYNADVTVSFTCADQVGLSGIKSCTKPVTLHQGGGQSVGGTAVDAAGNSASTTVDAINIDETDPSLSGAATTDPNANGWYNHDVEIHWTCSDALSGIAGDCPADSTVTGEGDNLGATESVSDNAGNMTTASVSGLHIDRTDPVTTAILPPPDSTNNWYAQGPSVTLFATDDRSGVDTTYYAIDGGAAQLYGGPFVEGLEGVHTVTFWSLDQAGNLEASSGANNSVTIQVDTTKPTITGARSPAPNVNDWNNTPVSVTFSCNDTESGVASCTSPTTLSSDGAGQYVTGTAVDNVGNQDSATVNDINIDTTPPTLSGAATTSPNGNGWYKDDVTVAWTCGDALSGVDGPCPSDSVVTGEGDNLSASSSITDKAGNSNSATVDGIHIDRHAPVTTFNADPAWTNSDVTIDLTASDLLSGVAVTHFIVDGGATHSGDAIVLTTEGTHHLEVWSVDNAGNVEDHHTATVQIDKSAPTITHGLSPEPNGAGWNNADVTVTFTCADQPGLSGVATCTPPQTVSTEGANQPVVGTATDNAGNSATDTASVNLDKSKPTITGSLDRPANGNGWYNDNVTATFDCEDQAGLSGILSCSMPATLGEGAGQSVTGSATDVAGNSDSVTLHNINVDKTKPTIDGAATTPPNSAGWYKADVTIAWTCSDALSGIPSGSCPGNSVVTGEGDNLGATQSVDDRAGNTGTKTVSGIHIDRHAPVTTASAPDPGYPSGWYAAPVTVTLQASDDRSGVDKTYYSLDGGAAALSTGSVTVDKGVHTLTWWSRDNAGNVENKSANSMTLKVDNLPPTISGAPTTSPNGNGWYNHAVTVHFTCGDAETAVASCEPDRIRSADGAGQQVKGTATDVAGNSSSVYVGPINIDTTAPVFAPYTANVSLTLGQLVPTPTCGASDGLSGLAGCTLAKTGSGWTNPLGVGDFVYTFTATDKADNSATKVVTFHVGYTFLGFTSPVGTPGHDVGSASAFKAGSTIPMKFQLLNSTGAVVQASYMPVWVQPVDLGPASTAATASASATAPTVGGSFKWDATAKQYIFTWQTPKSGAGHYFRVGVQLDSGDVVTTLIVLT